jgi:hypothetical protein
VKRLIASCLASIVMLGSAGLADAALIEEEVIIGPTDQFGPAAEGDDWVGWSQFHDPYYGAHIRMADGTDHRRLVRRAGRHTFLGAFDPVSDRVIFQEALRSSNIYYYRTNTDQYVAPPAGINTDLWEWAPDMSETHILFGRNRFTTRRSPWKVILYNRVTKAFDVLAQAPNRCSCIFPETVNDRYATWTKCAGRCNVFVYEIETAVTTKIPKPSAARQYGAAPTEDGQVYFVRSSDTCGANVQIMRRPIDLSSGAEAIHQVPAGWDMRWRLYLVHGLDDNDDLYYDRASCSDNRYRGDIYVLRNVNLAGPLARHLVRIRRRDHRGPWAALVDATGSDADELRPHPRASGFVRHVGPPSPLREISSPS